MSYVGGKHRVRKELASLIIRECQHLGVREVWEPFCGGLHVTAELGRRGYGVHASDLSAPAITLYKAVRLGWSPPMTVLSKKQWDALKAAHQQGKKHPLISLAGFASFNGVFFAGHDADPRWNRFKGTYTGIRDRLRSASIRSLRQCSYAEVLLPPGVVIYCDPPYANTDPSAYRSLADELRQFDSQAFWDWCRARRDEGSTVLVSEYTAPDDATLLHTFILSKFTAQWTGKTDVARDNVYIYRGRP